MIDPLLRLLYYAALEQGHFHIKDREAEKLLTEYEIKIWNSIVLWEYKEWTEFLAKELVKKNGQ